MAAIASPVISEPQLISLEIPDEIFVGESLNVSATFSDDDISILHILYLEIDNYSHPNVLDYKEGPWEKSIPNLEAGTIPWTLVVNSVVVESGEVEVIMPEDDSSQWPLVLVAVLFVLAFIGVEVSFKPGRRKKQLPDGDVEEIIEEPPEEEYESSSIIRDETGKKQ